MSRTRLVFMLQTCKFLVKGYYEPTARIDKQKHCTKSLTRGMTVREMGILSIHSL